MELSVVRTTVLQTVQVRIRVRMYKEGYVYLQLTELLILYSKYEYSTIHTVYTTYIHTVV